MNISEIWKYEKKSEIKLPLYLAPVAAGFPSPADDYIDKRLDLNDLLIKRPAATFFVKAQGDSMIEAGINNDDILIVDKSIEPISGQIIIAWLNGEFTVKRLQRENNKIILEPANPNYSKIIIAGNDEFEVWGVVTFVIHDTQA